VLPDKNFEKLEDYSFELNLREYLKEINFINDGKYVIGIEAITSEG
jgi:hypothetical protein